MKTFDVIRSDPRLTVRRSGEPDPDGRCVVYWMQRAQRGVDNPALSAAIDAGNCLGKPVVVYFHLVPHAHHANQRHYQFLVEGPRRWKREKSAGCCAATRTMGYCAFVPRCGLVWLSRTRIR